MPDGDLVERMESWSRERLDAELKMDGQRLVEPAPVWKDAVCCCANGGRPYELNGVLVTSWNAGCRVHRPPILFSRREAQAEDETR